MFLNYIKNFFTQKIVKKNLDNARPDAASQPVKTVGIVFDESYFYEKQSLIAELIKNGLQESDIKVLVFKNKIKKNESFDYPVFSSRDLSWQATFSNSDVKDFIAQKLDLLISYYDTEKPALMLVTNSSKARFKVGFASIDKKLNHFMIDTTAENYKVFVEELFKYLKILNKI